MDESGKGGKKRSRKNGEKKMNGEERTATSTINDDNQPNDRANIDHSVLRKKGELDLQLSMIIYRPFLSGSPPQPL